MSNLATILHIMADEINSYADDIERGLVEHKSGSITLSFSNDIIYNQEASYASIISTAESNTIEIESDLILKRVK